MRRMCVNRLRCLDADQNGAASIEWTLLVVAFGIPMVAVFRMLLALMSEYYGMITFLETLPLP